MQIVQFFEDEDEAESGPGRTFALDNNTDLNQVGLDSGFSSYKVLRQDVESLEVGSVEILVGQPVATVEHGIPEVVDVRLYQLVASSKR